MQHEVGAGLKGPAPSAGLGERFGGEDRRGPARGVPPPEGDVGEVGAQDPGPPGEHREMFDREVLGVVRPDRGPPIRDVESGQLRVVRIDEEDSGPGGLLRGDVGRHAPLVAIQFDPLAVRVTVEQEVEAAGRNQVREPDPGRAHDDDSGRPVGRDVGSEAPVGPIELHRRKFLGHGPGGEVGVRTVELGALDGVGASSSVEVVALGQARQTFRRPVPIELERARTLNDLEEIDRGVGEVGGREQVEGRIEVVVELKERRGQRRGDPLDGEGGTVDRVRNAVGPRLTELRHLRVPVQVDRCIEGAGIRGEAQRDDPARVPRDGHPGGVVAVRPGLEDVRVADRRRR